MKTILVLSIFLFGVHTIFAQVSEKEKKARELHKVLLSDNKAEWKKFIETNFTREYIERPMLARMAGEAKPVEKKEKDTVEGKVQMFARLHEDFGSSKIKSVTTEGDVVVMNVTDDDGLTGAFRISFTASAPFLIDRMGIQLER